MNEEDFQSIVEKHTDFVYNVAYRMVSNAQDAEDITQETFLSAYRSWDRFRGGSWVSTWLYRIAVNACLNASA
jgi:RNA polymerase sigma-70 factor (ECF subfamily)